MRGQDRIVEGLAGHCTDWYPECWGPAWGPEQRGDRRECELPQALWPLRGQ